MDSVDIGGAATSRGRNNNNNNNNKLRVNKKSRVWHKRLHLRKTAVQPLTMQSEDKRGPKKIAGAWEQSSVWPSSQKEAPQAGNSLRFSCSQCRDDVEYVPKDLVKHFEEKHRGSPPLFTCHTCSFSAHEFSSLQVHLLSHKDTFSSCSICDDGVQRTWPEFSAHLTMHHRKNDKYSCETCQKFSTGDVGVFLEHVYAHNLGLEEDKGLSLHTKGKNKFGNQAKATNQNLRCQHCGFEASQKWLITKHIKEAHVCQNGNQRKRKNNREEVCSLAMKPNDPIPKMKPRLTRSAVREMCWLTQDCLSLPGREFLDKYCHLSDPQTTLEETQQFLMKSVAGETGDQKWTKALKTVLSNVPQDMNLHPKSENGLVSNSSDLTVLTVKNKITVAQNGASYGKRLKMMTDKDAVSPEGPDDARHAVDRNGQSNSSDHASCPPTGTKLNSDVSTPAQSEPSQGARMQENRENRELKSDQEMEEHGKKPEEPKHEDGINTTSELKLTNESKEQTSTHKVVPKTKGRRRRRRRARSKRVNKRSPGSPLKIVLKKNPVKEKQWVSQSSLSPSGAAPMEDAPMEDAPMEDAPMEDCHGEPISEIPPQILQNTLLAEVPQKKWTKAPEEDMDEPSEAPQSEPSGEEPVPSGAAEPTESKNTDGNTPQDSPSTDLEMQNDAEKSALPSEAEVNESGSASRTERPCWISAADAEMVSPETLQTSAGGSDGLKPEEETSSAADGENPQSHTKSDPQHVITAQDQVNSEDPSLPLSEPSVASCPGLHSNPNPPAENAIPPPKSVERTLKLVAISPSQLVKRPAGDQPVVVLNHPDADVPEVVKIMEVINRYRGEVQKVVLSRRTLNALAIATESGELPDTADSTDPARLNANKTSVQERFLLKLKFRRLSRKKYEVVGAVSPSSRDAAAAKKFRCWFCGRVFSCREAWTLHRQRHLMEWKRPNCENS
ncbi:RE1-silencing transcription factor [Centropristis striata]|uniref:RE1-silencing transcription factor n=1 Tax=Centropristis striata TaxID=184440 RepID=UPI0027E0193D|nr:RE1-silencing transcription factor [Centropristis striata]